MCSVALKRKGLIRVDMDAVDRIMAVVDSLSPAQRTALECRILDHPGTMRAQFGAWAFLHRESLKEALPLRARPYLDTFWRAVDEVCRLNDQKEIKMPKCCRKGLERAKRALAAERIEEGSRLR